jgi:thioesterase domain-containing protein/acyl carrier protein
LKAWMCSAPLPMRPTHFYLVQDIPRMSSGKLNVRALTALDEIKVRRERAEPAEAPRLTPVADDHIAQTVARVWANVLLRPLRGPADDFFDSGGDSLKAMTFLTELERALGLELSLTLINDAPRFGQLCEALRKRRMPSTPLVTLKPGDGSPPLFFIHGIGGNVVEMLPTARRVTYPGAVIGVRARGVVPGETPHTRVESMAADYLEEIKTRQPHGPYFVCGYSFGGLVAFEIARQLQRAGDEVRFVGLFDTIMSPARWPLRVWGSVVGWHIRRLPRAVRGARFRTVSDSAQSAAPLAIRVRAKTLLASARFHPGFYDGMVTLFTPAERAPGLPSLQSVWRKHARSLTVIETAGIHDTMLSGRNAESTAKALTRCLLLE